MSDESFDVPHAVMNHLHVILGNLELIEDMLPDDRLVTDAREAAAEVNRLLRAMWPSGRASATLP